MLVMLLWVSLRPTALRFCRVWLSGSLMRASVPLFVMMSAVVLMPLRGAGVGCRFYPQADRSSCVAAGVLVACAAGHDVVLLHFGQSVDG